MSQQWTKFCGEKSHPGTVPTSPKVIREFTLVVPKSTSISKQIVRFLELLQRPQNFQICKLFQKECPAVPCSYKSRPQCSKLVPQKVLKVSLKLSWNSRGDDKYMCSKTFRLEQLLTGVVPQSRLMEQEPQRPIRSTLTSRPKIPGTTGRPKTMGRFQKRKRPFQNQQNIRCRRADKLKPSPLLPKSQNVTQNRNVPVRVSLSLANYLLRLHFFKNKKNVNSRQIFLNLKKKFYCDVFLEHFPGKIYFSFI